jgi:hypothetical protein
MFLGTVAVLLVAIVSFIDDIKPLSQLPRFARMLSLLAWFYDLNMFAAEIWLFPSICLTDWLGKCL